MKYITELLTESNSFDGRMVKIRSQPETIGNAQVQGVELTTALRGTGMSEIQVNVKTPQKQYAVYGDFYSKPVTVVPEVDGNALQAGQFVANDGDSNDIENQDEANQVIQLAKQYIMNSLTQDVSGELYDSIDNNASSLWDDESTFSRRRNPTGRL